MLEFIQTRLWRAWYWIGIPRRIEKVKSLWQAYCFASNPPPGTERLPSLYRFLVMRDPELLIKEAGFELIRRREKYREAGGGSGDEAYPVLNDVLTDWGRPMESLYDFEQTERELKRQGYAT